MFESLKGLTISEKLVCIAIQAGVSPSPTILAKELEISKKTVYRVLKKIGWTFCPQSGHFVQGGGHFVQGGGHFVQGGGHFVQGGGHFVQGGGHFVHLSKDAKNGDVEALKGEIEVNTKEEGVDILSTSVRILDSEQEKEKEKKEEIKKEKEGEREKEKESNKEKEKEKEQEKEKNKEEKKEKEKEPLPCTSYMSFPQKKEKKAKQPPKTSTAEIIEILNYLNAVAGTRYKPTITKTQGFINARLREGFVVDDFKIVIDTKSKDWLRDPDMKRFLRPETLFGNKFEGYLNQARLRKVQRMGNDKTQSNWDMLEERWGKDDIETEEKNENKKSFPQGDFLQLENFELL